MASPPITAPGTPAGLPLEDPFPTVLVFSLLPTASFWETSVKPSMVDGGEPLRRSNMRNTLHHTKAPRTLLEHGDIEVEAFYDPNLKNQIITSLINRKGGGVTIVHPDGTTESAWAYLRSFDPQQSAEGQDMPKCKLVIVVTNWDTANGVEQGPIIIAVSGT